MASIAINILALFLVLVLPSYSSAKPNVEKASHWISKLKSPDSVILKPNEIEALNSSILDEFDQMAVIDNMPTIMAGERLYGYLTRDRFPRPDEVRYNSLGEQISREFFDAIEDNMNLDGVMEENFLRPAVITERTDVRAFPTEEPILKSPGALEFDTFQYSSLFPPEKVVLLHISRDGHWGFFQTGAVRGWIEIDKVAFTDDDTEKTGEFLVVTGSSIHVFADKELRTPAAAIPMGTVIRLKESGQKKKGRAPWIVEFPWRSEEGKAVWIEAYIDKKADVHKGFLPYTKKNVIAQAFKMLGEEYGWGGRDGKRDCSIFIKDIFATMGIMMPRNSSQQGYAGLIKAHAYEDDTRLELKRALSKATPGITILTLRGHVMLYIGTNKGKPYVIHQIFGYMDRGGMKVLNKAAVTSLELGKRSKIGALKNRIKSVTEIRIPKGLGDNVTGLSAGQPRL